MPGGRTTFALDGAASMSRFQSLRSLDSTRRAVRNQAEVRWTLSEEHHGSLGLTTHGRSMKFAGRSRFDRVSKKGFSTFSETSFRFSRRRILSTRFGSGADALSWGFLPSSRPVVASQPPGERTKHYKGT